MRKQTQLVILLFITIFLSAPQVFAQDTQTKKNYEINTGLCTKDGTCLLCYISLSVESDEVDDLIFKYKLKYGELIYKEWKTESFSLLIDRDTVSGISIWPNHFKGEIPFGVDREDSWENLEEKFGLSESSKSEFERDYVKTFDGFYKMSVTFSEDLTTIWSINYSIINGVILTPNCFESGIESELKNNAQIIESVKFNTALSKLILSAQDNFTGVDKISLEGVYGEKVGSTLKFTFNVKAEDSEEAKKEFDVLRKKINNLWMGCCSIKADLEYKDDNEAKLWYVNNVTLDELQAELSKVKLKLEMVNPMEDGSIAIQLTIWKE